MITISRPPHYIHETLDSLLASRWDGVVHLVVGRTEKSYLERYTGSERIRILPWLPQTEDPLLGEALRLRAARDRDDTDRHDSCLLAKIVALSLPWGLFCEDDIAFDRDWARKLAEAQERLDGVYAIDLAHGTATVQLRGLPLVGSQALFFSSEEHQHRCARFLIDQFPSGVSTDILMGRYTELDGGRLYALQLVTHMGWISCFHAPEERRRMLEQLRRR
jgi:hypothetical protein